MEDVDQEHALRVARRKLWEYASRQRVPVSPISGAYEAEAPPSRQEHASQQERWVERYSDDLAIERAFRSMTTTELALVVYRYEQQGKWDWVARRLHVSREKALRMHREILRLVAHELGLTRRSA